MFSIRIFQTIVDFLAGFVPFKALFSGFAYFGGKKITKILQYQINYIFSKRKNSVHNHKIVKVLLVVEAIYNFSACSMKFGEQKSIFFTRLNVI